MLLWLAQFFQDEIGALRVFSFITFRAVCATGTALLIGLFAGPAVIRKLTAMKYGQAVRTDGPQTHLKKHGTPTMGGVLLLIAIGVSTLLWCAARACWCRVDRHAGRGRGRRSCQWLMRTVRARGRWVVREIPS